MSMGTNKEIFGTRQVRDSIPFFRVGNGLLSNNVFLPKFYLIYINLNFSCMMDGESTLNDCIVIGNHNHLICKRTLNHFTKLAKWLYCVVNVYLYGAFDVCSYHTLYSCLNAKELLACKRCDIWILSDCNGIWTLKIDIQVTKECRLTLKRVHGMIRTYRENSCI